MNSDYLLFIFEGVAAIAVISILFSKNVLYAALLLIIFLLALAGIYVLLQVEFLAVTQIMIYAGGVLVLMLFGIMLTVRLTGKPLMVETHQVFGGVLVGVGALFILVYSFQRTPFKPFSYSGESNNTQEIGFRLMSDFVAPFELAGILLLVSLIGAAVSATSSKSIN